METLETVCDFLETFAPHRLAEDWDNVGLLTGDTDSTVAKIMTCLTVTPESTAEAIEQQASLIVTHHPFPFHATKRITTRSVGSRMLWQLIRNGIAIYSPHTAFDSAEAGINQMLADQLDLNSVRPLVPSETDESVGAGRYGEVPKVTLLRDVLERIKSTLELQEVRFVGDTDRSLKSIAFACGSGGSFLSAAKKAGCDALVTGEATFHTCLEASAGNIALVLLGHYGSERFAVERLAQTIQARFPQIVVWASEREQNPIHSF